MNAPCSGAPLTAPHLTTGGLCRWKPINKVKGRHVGLDFYDLLIEGVSTSLRFPFAFLRDDECYRDCSTTVERQENGERPYDSLAQIESRSQIYFRPTILIIFQTKPRHPCTWWGLFPDGFSAEGSVYSTLAA
jgi:hypothetical protein